MFFLFLGFFLQPGLPTSNWVLWISAGCSFGLDPVSVLIWMVMLVIGSVTDVEVESVSVVVFRLDPVFVAGGAP